MAYLYKPVIHQPNPPPGFFAIAINPQNPHILYAAGRGIFKSMDGGESWQAVNEGLAYSISPPPGDFDKLSIDPVNPQTVYATMGRHVVFRTLNDGDTWERYNGGLHEGENINWYEGPISPVLIDYNHSDIVYVGTFGNGIFTSRMERLPTTTPTPLPIDCTDGWTQLKLNTYAQVSGNDGDLPNRVRAQADKQSEVIYQLYPGTIVKIIEGPFCTDNLVFWKVEHANIPGGTGWTAEGDLHDYWLEPYKIRIKFRRPLFTSTTRIAHFLYFPHRLRKYIFLFNAKIFIDHFSVLEGSYAENHPNPTDF